MSHADYMRGKRAGRAEGRRQGRREAFAEVDKAEAKCIAGIIAAQDSFYDGMRDAQIYLNSAYEHEDLEDIVDDDAVEVDFRSWKQLWLKKNEANSMDEAKVENDAKHMLRRHFLEASTDDLRYRTGDLAYFGIRNLKRELGLDFKRGFAALLPAKLEKEDYYRAGLISYLFAVASNINHMDADDLIESDPQARNPRIENYESFLEQALSQTAEQVASHLTNNAESAYRKMTKRKDPDFNGPAL